jgi:hypothetical protein
MKYPKTLRNSLGGHNTHHWLEEFVNMKMEYDFMKVELLIYQ